MSAFWDQRQKTPFGAIHLFRLAVILLVLVLSTTVVRADEVWEFVDGDGVVHMGNIAPPASRGVIWLSHTPQVKQSNSKVQLASALQFAGYDEARPHLEAAALSQSVDPALVIAVAAAESAFNINAVSKKGALGLMQVMPATAARYGVARDSAPNSKHAAMEPKVNALIGSRYLADLLRMFDGDKELALAAYNAGEGSVMKYGRRIPPYPETQKYVEKVMQFYHALAR